MLGAARWRSSFPWGGCCTCRNRPACRRFGVQPPRPPWQSCFRRLGPSRLPETATPTSMATIPAFGTSCGASEANWPRNRSKEVNVCPWSRLEGVRRCSWRAGKHCRPTHLHPGNLLDHLLRDHGSDPAQRDQALAMLAGSMPGGQAGPFASAQARSRTLALPTRARPAGGQGASQSAASSGAGGSAAVSSTGSAGASASGSGAERSAVMSGGPSSAATPSAGGRQGQVSGRAQGSSSQPPAPGAGGSPPSNDLDPAGDPDPAAQP